MPLNMSAVNRSIHDGINENHVKECVRYILCREGSKVPIPQSDIKMHLDKVFPNDKPSMNSIIIEAVRVLKEIYGYELIKVTVTTKQSKSSPKMYILVLNDNESNESSLLPTVTDNFQRKLLVAALTHIFMSGGLVKEDDMWKFLNDAGLIIDNDTYSRNLLTNKFKKQMYLEYNKLPAANGQQPKYEFKWGVRANYELPKSTLLDKVSQALGQSPSYWCEQYKEATEEPSS